MPVLLQGGAEFGSRCRAMDSDLLAVMGHRAGHEPAVVVLPLASPSGGQYDATGANAVRYYRSLGATHVTLAADPRRGSTVEADSLGPLLAADVVVLPGGSPSRLREALFAPLSAAGSPGTLAELLLQRLAAGAALSGSSAGAMLLGGLTALPEHPGPHGPLVANGVAAVPWAFVVPHWRGWEKSGGWLQAAASAQPAAAAIALGLPEQSGLLLDPQGATGATDGTVRARALGSSPVSLLALPPAREAVSLSPLDEEPLDRLLARVRDNQGS